MPAPLRAPSAVLIAVTVLTAATGAPAYAYDPHDEARGTQRGRIFLGGSPDDVRGERLRAAPHGPGREARRGAPGEPQAWTHGGRRLERHDAPGAWTHGGRVTRTDRAYGDAADPSSRQARVRAPWHGADGGADHHRHHHAPGRESQRFGMPSGAAAGGAHGWRDAARRRAGSSYPDGGEIPFTHPSLRRGPSVPAPLRRYPEER